MGICLQIDRFYDKWANEYREFGLFMMTKKMKRLFLYFMAERPMRPELFLINQSLIKSSKTM